MADTLAEHGGVEWGSGVEWGRVVHGGVGKSGRGRRDAWWVWDWNCSDSCRDFCR